MSAPSKSERSVSATNAATTHKVVSEKAWLAQQKELLKKEKIFTRQRDELSRLRYAQIILQLAGSRRNAPSLFPTG